MDSVKFEYALGLPQGLFDENRKRFLKRFKEGVKDLPAGSVMLFKGVAEIPVDSTDQEYEVKQESFFNYLFGVKEAGFYACIDVSKEEVTLFMEELSPLCRIAMVILTPEEVEKIYGFKCLFHKDIEGFVGKLAPKNFGVRIGVATMMKKIYLNVGVNTDSGLTTIHPQFEWLKKYDVDKETMYDILCESRVFKSDAEIKVMKLVAKAAVDCHLDVMRMLKPGMRESHIQAYARSYGIQRLNYMFRPYGDIVASGKNAATLHYVNNDKIIPENDLVLFDSGQCIWGYCSDITTTFPTSGKYTEPHKTIYNIVLKINKTIESKMKPGVSYRDMHLLAERILLTELKALGILNGDVKEMQEKRVSYLFMPHGLGHLIGLDTHDVGGYLKHTPLKIMKPGLKNLRNSRVLEKGMMMTVEPGCYFVDFLLQKGAELVGVPTSYINYDKLAPYMKMGGVRIEDMIVVTDTGIEIITPLPRSVEQVEAWMAGKDWGSVLDTTPLSDVE